MGERVPRLSDALRSRRAAGRGAVLAYLLVDRSRRSLLPRVVEALKEAGVAGLELGFPFSDPIADGPVLQAACARALRHGTTWRDLLDALATTSPILPSAVMTYANPPYQRGLREAMREIRAHGGDGLIVPDLSLEESGPWEREARRGGISLVHFASPATPPKRVAILARRTGAFLYVVAHYGTTGRAADTADAAARSSVGALVRSAHGARPDLPVLVGFGVRSPQDVTEYRAEGADGVVVGTAIEERLGRGISPDRLGAYARGLVRAAEGAFNRGARSARPAC